MWGGKAGYFIVNVVPLKRAAAAVDALPANLEMALNLILIPSP